MARIEPSRYSVPPRRRFAGAIAVLTAAAVLGGCAGGADYLWVPDYLNPVEWYRGTKDWIMGEDDNQAARPRQPPPGADKRFPSLSSVPARPTAATTRAERAWAANSLYADRRGARYSDQVVRRQADIRTALPRKPTPPVMSAVPARPVAPPVVRPVARPVAPPVARAPQRLAYAPIPGTESYLGGQGAAPAAARRFTAGLPESAGAGLPGSAKVATVYFASGSARISRDGEGRIRQAFEAYRSQGGLLRVVGHASSRTRNLDPMRHRIANFRISLDRANQVARALIRLGARPDAVFIEAMSDTDPVFSEMMPAGEAENRRVEILLER